MTVHNGPWGNLSPDPGHRAGSLAPPGEPPHDGGMERVARLEDHVGKLREDVATIKERLSHTATKAWIMGAVVTILVTTLIALISGFWWMAQQYLGPILRHLGQ